MPLELLLFAAACALLMAGYPVAFTLAGVALAFAGVGHLLGVFDLTLLRFLPNRIYGVMSNQTLLAAPLFIFMGVVLERSRIAEDLLAALARLMKGAPGGLALAGVLVGALLAASTGIVGATVVALGLLALPPMLERGYAPALAAGTVAASGTLGQIIPPSIALILLADQLSNAYQEAQRVEGVYSPEILSVGDVFAGAIIPGLLLVALYAGYVVLASALSKRKPRAEATIGALDDTKSGLFGALAPPLGLILAVLGSILAGAATPTEAAGVGVVGALLLAGLRAERGATGPTRRLILLGVAGHALAAALTLALDLRLGRDEMSLLEAVGAGVAAAALAMGALGVGAACLRLLRLKILGPMAVSASKITSMVFVILIGATVFALVFRGLGGDETVRGLLEAAPGGAVGALVIVMAVMFVLGFFLDFIEITFVVVPTVAPGLFLLGVDPVWLAVLMALNLQTSFLTPPFGFALFYLRGAAPPSLSTKDIYRGAAPFVLLQILALGLVAVFPALATWLPEALR